MVVSTLNPDEVPAARLRIIEEGEEPSAALVEKQRAGTEFQKEDAAAKAIANDRARMMAAIEVCCVASTS